MADTLLQVRRKESAMPFSDSEKSAFIAALVSRGWQLRDEVIWSPSGGLYFNAAHFAQWDPKQMKEVFTHRAARIEKLTHEGAAKSAAENHDVHWAADEVLRGHPAP
jgi:hypothetical protein